MKWICCVIRVVFSCESECERAQEFQTAQFRHHRIHKGVFAICVCVLCICLYRVIAQSVTIVLRFEITPQLIGAVLFVSKHLPHTHTHMFSFLYIIGLGPPTHVSRTRVAIYIRALHIYV